MKKKKKIEADILHKDAIKWAKKVTDETRRTYMQSWKAEQLSKTSSAPKEVSFAEDITGNLPEDLTTELAPNRPDHANEIIEHPSENFSLTKTFSEDN